MARVTSQSVGDSPAVQLGAGEFCGQVERRRCEAGLTLSELVHPRPWRLPFHAHVAAGICLLTAGSYREWIGSRLLEMRPGDAVYHPSDYEHRDEVGSAGARFFFVEVDGPFAHRLEPALPRAPVVDRGGLAATVARRLRREIAGDDPASALIREGLACELVGAFARQAEAERGTPAWLGRADVLLRERLDHRWSLAELATATGVSSVRLSRGFRRTFGESVGERLRRLRLEAARERLARPGSDLADVAFACGFADQSHMTRAFRAAFGTTPGRLRARSASA